jgi:hypothetical protein
VPTANMPLQFFSDHVICLADRIFSMLLRRFSIASSLARISLSNL